MSTRPADDGKPGHDAVDPVARRRTLSLLVAVALAWVVYLAIPDLPAGTTGGLDRTGRTVAAVTVLMAVLWVTEAIPVPVTALIPVALLPLLSGGSITVGQAAAPYSHELIYLFMGGFLLAIAMQRWGLHRRIALLTIRLVGTQPRRLVLGFMVASAILSMWVSNTATVVMMLPIALSVIALVRRELEVVQQGPPAGAPFPFAICLLLGIAYGGSIGGLGTLIGTPPNLLYAAFLREQLGIEVSFVQWMLFGVPLVAIFLPICWWLLVAVAFPVRLGEIPGGRGLIREELRRLGAPSRAEILVFVVFLLAACSWVGLPLLKRLQIDGSQPLAGLSDAGIALVAGLLLFVLPADRSGEPILRWKDALELPWGILLLFGGGLSLASAISSSGVASTVGHAVSGVGTLPVPAMVGAVSLLIVFLTELTSNTATTATFLPILAAVAAGAGIDPLLLTLPVPLAASCAFMMPVATPPNAIVFGSGEVTIRQMCRAGLLLNLIGTILVTVAVLIAVAAFR